MIIKIIIKKIKETKTNKGYLLQIFLSLFNDNEDNKEQIKKNENKQI